MSALFNKTHIGIILVNEGKYFENMLYFQFIQVLESLFEQKWGHSHLKLKILCR